MADPITPVVSNEPNTPPVPPVAPPAPPKDQTYEIVVDGEKRSVTIDEMKTLAQKAAGADKKFEDASTLRKEAQDGLRVKELITRFTDSSHTPSETEISELAAVMKIKPDELAQYLAEDGDAKPPQKEKDSDGKVNKEALIAALGFDPAEAKAILDFSHQRHIEEAKKEIRRISDEAVDKDEILGKMIIGEKKNDRLAVIKDLVEEDVLTKIKDGIPFGADLVTASVQKTRAYLTKFGIPGKPTVFPVTLGLGPGGGLPSEVQADEPIKRVSAAEDSTEENFVNRMLQKVVQKMRNAQ